MLPRLRYAAKLSARLRRTTIVTAQESRLKTYLSFDCREGEGEGATTLSRLKDLLELGLHILEQSNNQVVFSAWKRDHVIVERTSAQNKHGAVLRGAPSASRFREHDLSTENGGRGDRVVTGQNRSPLPIGRLARTALGAWTSLQRGMCPKGWQAKTPLRSSG